MTRHWQIAILLGLTALCGAPSGTLRADDDDDDRWEERWKDRFDDDDDDDDDDDRGSRRYYRDYRAWGGDWNNGRDWDDSDRWRSDRRQSRGIYSRGTPRYSTHYREDWNYNLPPNRAPRVYRESYDIEVSPRRGRGYHNEELPPPLPESGYGRDRYYDERIYDQRYQALPQYGYERDRLPPRHAAEPPSSVGARIGAQIGGLIGGSEGAQIGSSIGADVGSEVERSEWERDEARRVPYR